MHSFGFFYTIYNRLHLTNFALLWKQITYLMRQNHITHPNSFNFFMTCITINNSRLRLHIIPSYYTTLPFNLCIFMYTSIIQITIFLISLLFFYVISLFFFNYLLYQIGFNTYITFRIH